MFKSRRLSQGSVVCTRQTVKRMTTSVGSANDRQARVRDALAGRSEARSAEYTTAFDHNLLLIQGAAVVVLNTRSERQDRRLQKKIDGFREDLKLLIAKGEKEPPGT